MSALKPHTAAFSGLSFRLPAVRARVFKSGACSQPSDDSVAAVRNIVSAVSQGRVEVNDAVDNICEICSDVGKISAPSTSGVDILNAENMPAADLAHALEDLATRQHTAAARNVPADVYATVRQLLKGVEYHGGARMLMFTPPEPCPKPQRLPGTCSVVASSAQDLPLAYEAVVAAGLMGCYAKILQGPCTGNLASLMHASERLRTSDVLVVCAQADPALPGVIAGMVDSPVVALPSAAACSADPVAISATPGLMTAAPGNGVSAAAASVRMLRIAARYIQHRRDREQSRAPVTVFEGSEESHTERPEQQYNNIVATNRRIMQAAGADASPSDNRNGARELVNNA